MDETKSTSTTTGQNTETQAQDATGSGNAGKPEKLFTQEEVNRIVSDRLAREREKLDKPAAQPAEGDTLSDREKALNEREEAIAVREHRIDCNNLLTERGIADKHHALFLDLGIRDKETFTRIVDAFGSQYQISTITKGADIPRPPEYGSKVNSADAQIAAAFKPPKI